ncbi:MAG: aminotransferase class III-fold pyridoxal phosphate-dependent enzyme [Acidimicrobiia bacterium]|nr:aminotransferase class III-fold pyridoxal phosphate-dependent enzyme [Acidimicrobiia bacterium]
MTTLTESKSDERAALRHFDVLEQDAEFFDRHLRSFVPPGAFDAHGHLYASSHIGPTYQSSHLALAPDPGDWEAYRKQISGWMGDRTPIGGLFFPFPRVDVNMPEANRFLADQLAKHDCLRGLMLVRPSDDPAEVERQILVHGFSGIKVYLVYASRKDPYNAEIEEFLPDWMWELCNRRSLAIMLHIVKPRAIADAANQQYLRDHCRRYPNARLVLAHCARSFNAGHALEGLHALRGLDNVFFDTSAICEPQSIQEILRMFGPTRLMFGLDFPVSELRGRAVSVADGFLWLDPNNVDWKTARFGTHTVLGIENILAVKQACRFQNMTDSDVEQIFFRTAHQLLRMGPQSLGSGQELYRHAKKLIPGGTQLFSKRPEIFAPEQWPAYYREARGCTIVDMDGKHYVDMSFTGIGSCLLGYADPDVTAAVVRRVEMGSMCTLNVPEEVEVARLLVQLHPWAQNVRFTRAGGESLVVAVRIARAATGWQHVAICGYHGWHDWYLATNVGAADDRLAGHLLQGLDPAGVPSALAGTTMPFHYNRLDELDAIFRQSPEPVAAVVMEPTRFEDPQPGFLEGVRQLCDQHGAKLIFDEVSIGWKLALGGAHLKYGVAPDIAVFAKSTSNGHPMGAIIGNEETMQAAQKSFISSAYWTEGVGPAAALATITKMMRVDVVGHVARIGQSIKDTWAALGARYGLPLRVSGHNVNCGFALDHPQALALETLFTVRMLKAGFLAMPRVQVTFAHQPEHVAAYARSLEPVFAELAEAIAKGDTTERIGGPVKHSSFARLA